MNVDIFVQNVRYWCKQKGEPVTTVCEKCGAGKNFLSNIRSGSSPSVDKVQQLAQYLGCTVSDLLGESGTVPNSDTFSADELHLLAAYRAAPTQIRAIVDTALEPYEK